MPMSLAELSIKRPTFITCIIIMILAVGYFSARKVGVDLFPDVSFPVVVVSTPYPGAGPAEIETLVSKPMEEEISTLSGLKRLSSSSQEGLSVVVAEFSLETDVKYAEQQVRDRAGAVKPRLPTDAKEPIIRRVDPSDQPVITLSLTGIASEAEAYDLADQILRPKLESVQNVGLVVLLGGRKREIHVALDRAKLKEYELSATSVAQRLSASGENIPAGKVDESTKETIFRTLGEFQKISDIGETILNFFGANRSIRVKDVAEIKDSLSDQKSMTYVNGKPGLEIRVFKQSGANTIAVVDAIKTRMEEMNKTLERDYRGAEVAIIRDASLPIRANIIDVEESIMIGIVLAVLVVFLFLGNFRSTIITGLALPNSLIGAFILMALFGFTVNLMTLLALSLSVGLLIDDAIVVRENIFRRLERGEPSSVAALKGTLEVQLAVVATTLVVLAVFGPVAFLQGVVGQFFKQFGLVVCFAMLISLFDALTIAPMLSAYFAGIHSKEESHSWYARSLGRVLKKFDTFQTWLEEAYGRLLEQVTMRPGRTILISLVVFVALTATVIQVPKTFLPPADNGEFVVSIDLPPGSSLAATYEVAHKIDEILRSNPEVELSALTIGNRDGEANVAEAFVRLVSAKKRSLNTSEVKEKVRNQLKEFQFARPQVKDYDMVSGGMRPFNINIVGESQDEIDKVAFQLFEKLKVHPGLKDVDINSRPGKPEIQVVPDKAKLEKMGFSVASVGLELRTLIEGVTPAKFRESGREYDVRVRLREDQRNLEEGFSKTYVPNVNGNLVKLENIGVARAAKGPAKIHRQDRGRFVQISAEIAPGGGMGNVMSDIQKYFDSGQILLPPGVHTTYVGQAENFKELAESLKIAFTLATLFIFLVLASLYESFVTPLTIMLALPLAICGAIAALYVTHESLNIFSMIGIILLLGVATKNSILLVDYANTAVQNKKSRNEAIIEAGKARLRPILMTTFALIAGTIPIALGLNEASRQRVSMGVAIIGGLISSTLLTLLVVPASFSYIDRFRVWAKTRLYQIFSS